jgi:hypothetical protein
MGHEIMTVMVDGHEVKALGMGAYYRIKPAFSFEIQKFTRIPTLKELLRC